MTRNLFLNLVFDFCHIINKNVKKVMMDLKFKIKKIKLYFPLYNPMFLNFHTLKAGLTYLRDGLTNFPISINFLLTNRCDLKCQMCSFFSVEKIYDEEMSFSDIKSFISKIRNYHPIIALGGGEPFLKPEIDRIIALIKQYKLSCIIMTNGYSLSKSILADLKKVKLDFLIVSLYGLGKIHDEIVGVPGAYDKIMQNIEYIINKEITHLIISTLLLEKNISSLKKMTAKLFNLGVKKIKIENLNFITPKEKMLFNWQINGFDLSPHTLIRETFNAKVVQEMFNIVMYLLRKYRGKLFLKPHLSYSEFQQWYNSECLQVKKIKFSCHFIRHSIFIAPNGDIIPCQFFKNCVLGNIREEELALVWKSQNYNHFRALIEENNLPLCLRCCK